MFDIRIIISALNKASGDISKVKSDIEGVGKAGKEADGGVKSFDLSLKNILGTAALVTGAIAGVGLAIKEVYEGAKEGAKLDYAKDKFDALTASIGTTSTALLVDLRAATSGLVSDADLIEGAGQMMALGLATTHDEAVRLATVAGELDMNMNQLVLTLTNKTTMRFDTLGVSIVGFDDKLKALEETGLSTQEAFTEAFLQQAEEQISKVGSAADSAIGGFKVMEAGIKNLGDAAKENLLDLLAPAIEKIGGYLSKQGLIAQSGVTFNNLVEDMNNAMLPTTRLKQEFKELTGPNGVIQFDNIERFNELIVEYYGDITTAKEGTQNWADANYDSAAGMAAAQAAAEAQVPAIEAVADATNNADAAMRKYTEALLFKIASEGLSQESAYSLAVAMGLVDEKTIAATKQVDVYRGMLDAGIITQREYNLLVEQLANDLDNLPDGENIEIETNVEDVLDDLDKLVHWTIKPIPIVLDVDDSAVRSYSAPAKYGTVSYSPVGQSTNAVGGAVYGGKPYTWQEYGYRGELFVPSADGFVLSRADAERALSKALATGGGEIDADAIGKAVARAMAGALNGKSGGGGNVYNLTMPTSNNPADVRTAYELMEAWNA